MGSESSWAAITVPTGLADATVRGALRVGMGKAALVGIVSAEAIALMKGVLQTMTTTKLIALAAAVLTACLVTTGVGLLASPGQGPGAQAKGQPPSNQEPPSPANAAQSPDDQLDALLRQYEDGLESNRRATKGQMGAAEKKAQMQANVAQLQGIEGQLLELAKRHPRTGAAERALLVLVNYHVFGSDSARPGRSWPGTTRGAIESSRSWTGSSSSTGPPRASRTSCTTPRSRTLTARSAAWPATGWRRSSGHRAQYLRFWAFQPPELNQL